MPYNGETRGLARGARLSWVVHADKLNTSGCRQPPRQSHPECVLRFPDRRRVRRPQPRRPAQLDLGQPARAAKTTVARPTQRSDRVWMSEREKQMQEEPKYKRPPPPEELGLITGLGRDLLEHLVVVGWKEHLALECTLTRMLDRERLPDPALEELWERGLDGRAKIEIADKAARMLEDLIDLDIKRRGDEIRNA